MAHLLSPELIQQISDVGVLICISVIVLVFIVKILDFLLSQAKTVSSSISPKLSSILTFLSTMKTEVIGTITAHNTSANNTFCRVLNQQDEVCKRLTKIEDTQIQILKSQELMLNRLKLRDKQQEMILEAMIADGIVTREQIDAIINSIDTKK